MESSALTAETAHRTLAAIVFTDAVGYSARVSTDEEGTVVLIRQDLEVMSRLCNQFEGQVIKSRGDGLMMIFSSAVAAVTCAVEIQKSLMENAKEHPETEAL